MLASTRTLSLIEQKRLQWAKEKEEMVGLYGLWGRPNNIENKIAVNNHSNRLPPIEGKNDPIKAEESETSGYLSDSPKPLKDKESNEKHHHINECNEDLNNETSQQAQYWNEVNPVDQENSWAKKMCKNYKNEDWANRNSDSHNQQRFYQTNKNFWYGTPDSLSSDEGSRLRWGDRGVGIGHLWEPAVKYPDCRLPLVADPYRQTPKWVEKGLKNAEGKRADILIIHHPDDAQYDPPPKNYLLGQNVLLPPEVIEERERRRKRALENQNAIKKQLEERELKRRQEKENRIREERLEEERIQKEQEVERLRYEDEQKKIKKKEEIEKKKEEVMREAIELAEKRAREERRLNKRNSVNNANYKNFPESDKKLERNSEQPEQCIGYRRHNTKTPRFRNVEIAETQEEKQFRKENKSMKDSSCQFDEIQLTQNFQLLNVNGLPVDGGLALMLDHPSKDSSFILPPDGVQLALLMSPRIATAANGLMPTTPLVSSAVNTGERILTPNKYRIAERLRLLSTNKSTQTDLQCLFGGTKTPGAVGKGKKYSRMCGTHSGSSGASQKCSGERHYKHIRCFLSSKYRAKNHSTKSLDDRPKWGINRPLVQYKKQSEKDPYYQKKMKDRLKKAELGVVSFENVENVENTKSTKEKEISSEVRLLEYQTDEDENHAPKKTKESSVLQNGYRMNSNLSSPVFVPIRSTLSDRERAEKRDPEQFEFGGNENAVDNEENAAVPGSVGFLTQTQLEAIQQIASLREVESLFSARLERWGAVLLSFILKISNFKQTEMIKLDDFLSKKKEPAQVLDLSRVRITSKEDFKKYLDKIPECKMKPEKILPESLKINDKEFSFVSGKKEEKQGKEYNYPDPTPPDMRGAKLQDLCPVNIDWKMLTTLRPKTKTDEDMFSRLVQLGKLNLKYQQALQREKLTDWVKKTKNPKSSIVEMRTLSCKECGEDFCDNFMCSKLMYDCFLRPQASTSAPTPSLLLAADPAESKKKKKKKKKKGKKKIHKTNSTKSKRKRLGKNSIFNRPLSRGCNRDHSRWTRKSADMPRVRALSSTRSFSTEKQKTSFFERRSRSAPRIHFERNVLDQKPKGNIFTSDSGPSESDFSSHSDYESPCFSRKFFSSELRLSGRRKPLSARAGFPKNSQTESHASRRSQFVRRCTLYKSSHSDAYSLDSQACDSSSQSSSPTRLLSKSSEKKSTTSAKYPSTVQIQFGEDYETPGLRFPEKIFLANRIANTKTRSIETRHFRSQVLNKIAEGFSKIELGFDHNAERKFLRAVTSLRPKKEICAHFCRTGIPKLSKFSGPYLKAKGLFERKLK